MVVGVVVVVVRMVVVGVVVAVVVVVGLVFEIDKVLIALDEVAVVREFVVSGELVDVALEKINEFCFSEAGLVAGDVVNEFC